MPAVNAMDGITYGFRLIGYFLAVGIVGGVVTIVGSGFMGAGAAPGVGGSANPGMALLGGLIALAGVLVIYAGTLGVMYKVIGDGVKAGIEAAE